MRKSERIIEKSLPNSPREKRARARRENRLLAKFEARRRESKKKGKAKGGDDVVVGEDDVVELEDTIEGEEPTVEGSERVACDGSVGGDNGSIRGGKDGAVRSGDDDEASVRHDPPTRNDGCSVRHGPHSRDDGGSVKVDDSSWKTAYEMWANESDPDDVDFVGERAQVDGTSEEDEDEGVSQKRKRDVSEDEDEGVGMNQKLKGKKGKGRGKNKRKKSRGNRKVKVESEESEDEPNAEPETEATKFEESESEDEEDLLERFEYEVEEDVARFVDEFNIGRREIPDS